MGSTEHRTQKNEAFNGIEEGVGSWLLGYNNKHWLLTLLVYVLLALMIVGVIYVLWHVGYPDPREVELDRR